MRFAEFCGELASLEANLAHCEDLRRRAAERRDEFLKQNLGCKPGDVATIGVTVEMISRIFEMMRADEEAK